MINKIKILPYEEMKIIKKINLVTKIRFETDVIIGFFLYERELNDSYKFLEKKKEERDTIYLSTYPKQEDFPEDLIDNILFETIKINYPTSNLHNELLFTTSDVENLTNLIKQPYQITSLIIRPDFSGQRLEGLVGMEFEAFTKRVNLYTSFPAEITKDLVFFGTCNFEKHKEIYNSLEDIKFI
jgi:hypothetical protein